MSSVKHVLLSIFIFWVHSLSPHLTGLLSILVEEEGSGHRVGRG